jgi:sulfur-carrier protein
MKLLYFAWLRQRTGKGEEDLSPPASVTTVAELVEWLKSQGPGYARAFSEMKSVRVAVNQDYVPFTHKINSGDEVAFFPPVTGG